MKITLTLYEAKNCRCTICGNKSDHFAIAACGRDDELGGIVICEDCIDPSPIVIDARLEMAADENETRAKAQRALIGRLILPTSDEWDLAVEDGPQINREDDDAAQLRALHEQQ